MTYDTAKLPPIVPINIGQLGSFKSYYPRAGQSIARKTRNIKPPEVIDKLFNEKLSLKHFNPNHLERITSYLTLGDISNLTLLSKKFNKKMKSP